MPREEQRLVCLASMLQRRQPRDRPVVGLQLLSLPLHCVCRYSIYSPREGQACADHDRATGEGVTPQVRIWV